MARGTVRCIVGMVRPLLIFIYADDAALGMPCISVVYGVRYASMRVVVGADGIAAIAYLNAYIAARLAFGLAGYGNDVTEAVTVRYLNERGHGAPFNSVLDELAEINGSGDRTLCVLYIWTAEGFVQYAPIISNDNESIALRVMLYCKFGCGFGGMRATFAVCLCYGDLFCLNHGAPLSM